MLPSYLSHAVVVSECSDPSMSEEKVLVHSFCVLFKVIKTYRAKINNYNLLVSFEIYTCKSEVESWHAIFSFAVKYLIKLHISVTNTLLFPNLIRIAYEIFLARAFETSYIFSPVLCFCLVVKVLVLFCLFFNLACLLGHN